MTTYRIEFVAPATFVAYVDAVSESAARQAFIDGDTDGEILTVEDSVQYLDEFSSVEIIGIREDAAAHAEDCDLDEDCSCGAQS